MTAATLSDFLLTRIAEDEVRVRDEGIHPGGPPGLGSVLPDWEERRWLAECKAKRQIVGLYLGVEEAPAVHADAWTALKWAIRRLAAVYSDHPDYRDEWRP